MNWTIYDFSKDPRLSGDQHDGSDEMLRPEDRVSEDERKSPRAGALKRAQDERRRREGHKKAG